MRREGGRDWLIVGGAMIAHAIAFGLVVYTFTVFFPPILAEFGAGKGATAWVVSLATALMLGASSISGVLTDRFGSRRLMLVGAALIGTGIALSSVAGTVWQLILTYGLIAGAGASMTFVPAIAAVGRTFVQRRGLALGLAAAGTGMGTIVLAPIASDLIADHGWRVALRLFALASIGALAVAASLMPPRVRAPVRGPALATVRHDRTFRLIFASSVVASFGYWVPFFFMGPYAEDHGLSRASAAGIVAIMGVANTLGRVIMGGVADRVGRRRIMQASSAAMAITMLAWPLATTWGPLVIFGLAYGTAAGTFIALLPALAGDYFGAERLGGVTGLIFSAAALGTLLSAPVSGSIFGAAGGYTLGIMLGAGTLVIGTVPLLLLPDARPAMVASASADG